MLGVWFGIIPNFYQWYPIRILLLPKHNSLINWKKGLEYWMVSTIPSSPLHPNVFHLCFWLVPFPYNRTSSQCIKKGREVWISCIIIIWFSLSSRLCKYFMHLCISYWVLCVFASWPPSQKIYKYKMQAHDFYKYSQQKCTLYTEHRTLKTEHWTHTVLLGM